MGILTGSLKARSLATLYDIKSSDNKSAIKNKIYQHFQSVVRKSLDVHIEQEKKKSLRHTLCLKQTLNLNRILTFFQITTLGVILQNCALVHIICTSKQAGMARKRPHVMKDTV